jgi:hypothetical protein
VLILPNTSSLVRLTNGSAGTLAVCFSAIDVSGTTFTPTGDVPTNISTATTTTIVPAPAASTVRNVKEIVVANTHASQSQACTIQKYDGTDSVDLWKGTLLAGERVIFDETGVWTYYGADGVAKASVSSGQYIQSTLLTSGTSFTTSATTRKLKLRLAGGGGGGAGCTSVASAASAGGGGGAGGYAEWTVAVNPSTAYTYAIGAAGTGASGAAGNNGGNTTFTVGATTVTANGGQGAPVATALTTLSAYRGGTGGAVSTNGDMNVGGDAGEMGVVVVVATPVGVSGRGGSGIFGAGGAGISAVGNGNAGTGYGAGGGGALTGASAVRTGGNGTAGCIVVEEYT